MVGKWIDYNGGGGVVLIASDGTGFSNLFPSSEFSLSPHSVLTTTSVVFYLGDPDRNSKVWIVEPNGAPRQFLPASVAPDAWPRLSPDGEVDLLRERWKQPLARAGRRHVARQPDGHDAATGHRADRLAGTAARSLSRTRGVKIVDVTTKTSRMLSVACGEPRDSPDGASFACRDSSTISTIHTDGTNASILVSYDDYRLEDYLTGRSMVSRWQVDSRRGVRAGVCVVRALSGRMIPLPALHDHLLQASFVR